MPIRKTDTPMLDALEDLAGLARDLRSIRPHGDMDIDSIMKQRFGPKADLSTLKSILGAPAGAPVSG